MSRGFGAVAGDLFGHPEVIFLDEPTTGFDPAARRASWSMIRSLTELGKTVLLTTHSMDEAQALADRIAVVAGGRIIAEGTPDTLGGRDRQHTVGEARLPNGIGTGQLPDFGTATVVLRDRTVRIETTDGVCATHRLGTHVRHHPRLAQRQPAVARGHLPHPDRHGHQGARGSDGGRSR